MDIVSEMERAPLTQRHVYQYQDSTEDLDNDLDGDDDDSSNSSSYGADQEDNDEYQDNVHRFEDPGPFQYNKKMLLVSLPCAVMVLALVGELFLMASSFGAGVIVILDPKGENKRCLILFTLLFVGLHTFTIYSILPYLWLSLFNIFLIGVVNIYFILTGGLMILQFSYFRKHERKLAVTIEKMLFTVYPWCCVVLLTWASSALMHWKIVPYVYLAFGFVYIGMFLIPHSSSFLVAKLDEAEHNVIPEVISLFMALVYVISPSILHLALHIINGPFSDFFTINVLLHFVFILSLSIFLTTMMSVRSICDFTGWQYKYVLLHRWITGVICTLLIYPVLRDCMLSSHLLPWLPAGIGVYAVYGTLFSDKSYKRLSLILLPLPCVFFGWWMTWLPWKIIYSMLFGITIQTLCILLFINCLLCFSCMYAASYLPQRLFEVLLTAQSVVLCGCEMLLYTSNLYPKAFPIVTAAVILYMYHRLHVSNKISILCTTLCASVHVTKTLIVVIYYMIGMEESLTMYRCVCLFGLSTVLIQIISLETTNDRTVKDVLLYNCIPLSVAIVINSNPILHLVCVFVLWEQPTATDLLGLSVATSGVCIIIVGSLQLPARSVTTVRQIGVVCSGLGMLILVLQPTLAISWSSLFQWGDLCTVILVMYVLLSNSMTTLKQLIYCAALNGIFPGIRLATLLYSSDGTENPTWTVLVHVCLYVPSCGCLILLLFIFFKVDLISRHIEKALLYICCCLAMLSILLVIVDIRHAAQNETVMSLPAWKLVLATTFVISIALKILSSNQDLLILLTDKDTKTLPRLPLIGNITTCVTFILTCLNSPVHGFLNDIWCCTAALIFLCLQKDHRLFRNISKENQIVPTIFICIGVLYFSGLMHSDLWHSAGLSFLRSILEILSMFSVIPMFYVFWGILWKSVLVLSEQVVVFLLPLNTVYLLYGSSYASQALGIVGLYAGIWMMTMKLPLNPYHPAR